MLHSIELYDFRNFKNMSFKLGKKITVIAGQNATGKSTILGLLGNSCELKKSNGTTVLGEQFRAEFNTLFKASKAHDIAGSNKLKINFTDMNFNGIKDYRLFRTAWQNIKNKKTGLYSSRFRIIPKVFTDAENKKFKESKVSFPVIYLGLGRLFPIGETEDENLSFSNLERSPEDHEWLINSYNEIMCPMEEPHGVSTSKVKYIKSKNAFGIDTDSYDYFANSAGQDNIGQILLAALSFIKLSQSEKYNYEGGLLLIDEFDATLHPSVQKRLFDFLFKQIAKPYNVQIVFTTHSGELLQYVCGKIPQIQNNAFADIQLIYLTTANNILSLYVNPVWEFVKNDLNDSSGYLNSMRETIPVYTEDPETMWFVKNLLSPYIDRLEFIEVSMGCTELAKLRCNDKKYFSKILFTVDGDAKKSDDAKVLEAIEYDNFLILPGDSNPEQELYNFLINLSDNDPFWIFCSETYPEYGMSKRFLRVNGPNSNEYSAYPHQREKDKKWFRNNIVMFENLKVYDLWVKHHEEDVRSFQKEFKDAFNRIAKQKTITSIR